MWQKRVAKKKKGILNRFVCTMHIDLFSTMIRVESLFYIELNSFF